MAHGITSVGLVAMTIDTRTKIRIHLQCLTLAPTVNLKAKVASEEDKEWLAGTLHHLKQTSTGSLEGDVVKLSVLIDE
jgi:hypothetical protein